MVWPCFKPLAFLYLRLSCFCVLFGFSTRNQQKRSGCDLAIKRKIKIIHLIFFKEEKPQEVSIVLCSCSKTPGFLETSWRWLLLSWVSGMSVIWPCKHLPVHYKSQQVCSKATILKPHPPAQLPGKRIRINIRQEYRRSGGRENRRGRMRNKQCFVYVCEQEGRGKKKSGKSW